MFPVCEDTFSLSITFDLFKEVKADINDSYLCTLQSRFLGSRSPVASTGAGLWGNVVWVRFPDTDDRVTTHINKTLSLQRKINQKG